MDTGDTGCGSGAIPHRILQDVIIHIEVGCVSGRRHVRNVGGLGRPDVVPVDPAEEWMALEVRDPIQAKSTLPGTEEALDQVFGVARHVGHVGRELESLLEAEKERREDESTGSLDLEMKCVESLETGKNWIWVSPHGS